MELATGKQAQTLEFRVDLRAGQWGGPLPRGKIDFDR